MTFTHEFRQAPDAPVDICNAFVLTQLCGKWPDHHWHTGDPTTCTCGQCKRSQPLSDAVHALRASAQNPRPPRMERPMSEDQVDPQTPGTITGYRKHDQDQIDTVNKIKEIENDLGQFIANVRTDPRVDDDLARRAAETLQIGFMLFVRSIFQPDTKLKP